MDKHNRKNTARWNKQSDCEESDSDIELEEDNITPIERQMSNSEHSNIIKLRYSSCCTVDGLINTLSKLGNECYVTFNDKGLRVIHSNSDNKAIVVINIDINDMTYYKIGSDVEDINLLIDLSSIKSSFPKKKTAALCAIIGNDIIKCGIKDISASNSTTIDRNDPSFTILPSGYDKSDIDLPPCPKNPQVKIETINLRRIIDDLKNKKCSNIMIVPYYGGVEFLTLDESDNCNSRSPYGELTELYFESDERADYIKVYDTLYKEGTFMLVSYEIFSIISEIIKSCGDSMVIKIYFGKECIKVTSTIQSGGTWELYLHCYQ